MKTTPVIIFFLVCIAASREEPNNPTHIFEDKVIDDAFNAFDKFKIFFENFTRKTTTVSSEGKITAHTDTPKPRRCKTRKTTTIWPLELEDSSDYGDDIVLPLA